jgi:CBS domain-containing protein
MEIELIEIQQFLAQHPPFNVLPEEALKHLPEQLEIIYLRRGTDFPPHANKCYIVRSGALELADQNSESLYEKLAEGALYVADCKSFNQQARSGKAIEDSLLYMADCHLMDDLGRTYPKFGEFFTYSLHKRLQNAVANLHEENPLELANQQPVSDLIRHPPVCIETDQSIQAAAKYMTEQNVSSLLISDQGKLAGILTDRDFRKRCLAVGRSVTDPVSAIMTADPHTISPETSVNAALLCMVRRNIHHLPVCRGDEILGMFTTTDIMLNQGGNAALLAGSIAKAPDTATLVKYSTRIPLLHRQWVNNGANAAQLGETLSRMTDAITIRLLQLAEAELGPPPVPYVWMAGGSQGRLEQSSHSDQDNALLISDVMQPTDDAYFAELSKFVSDGLNACGFIYCPGDAMATNAKWRQPLVNWLAYYAHWVGSPDPMALMLASIFFDLRPVHGDMGLFQQLQAQMLELTRGNQFFLAYLMSNAMQHRPPLGFFRQFVLIHDGQHDDTLDLKHTGIVPLTDIARVLALAGGIEAVNTLQRLDQAAEKKLVSTEMADNLKDAWTFIAGLRIRHQAAQIARDETPDNFLDPKTLPSLERGYLKDAFRIIQTQQEVMVKRYGADNLR